MNNKILKIGLRSIMKDKILSVILLVGLTIGITSLALIAAFVDFSFSFDNYHKDAENIYRVVHYNKDKDEGSELTKAKYTTLLNNVPGIHASTKLFRMNKAEIKAGDNQFTIDKSFFVDSGFFNVFSFNIIDGKNTALLQNPYEAVITESYALKIWGKTDVTGEVFSFYGNDYIIQSVIEDVPSNSHFRFDILFSFSSWNKMFARFSNEFYTYFRIERGTNVANVLDNAMRAIQEGDEDLSKNQNVIFNETIAFQPLLDIYLNSDTFQYKIGNYGSMSLINNLFIIAISLLVILVMNFSGMLTVKFLKRFKELGVRKVLGAGKLNLVLQILTESALLIAISLAASIIVIYYSIIPFGNMFDVDLSYYIVSIHKITLFVVAVCLFIGLASSIIPSYKIIADTKPVNIFAATKSPKKKKLMFSIVSIQLAVASALVPALLIMLGQINYLHNKNIGFNKDSIVYFENKSALSPTAVIDELQTINGVKEATASQSYPGQLHSGMTLCRFDLDKSNEFTAYENRIQKNFISTYGLTLIAGRDFIGDNEDEKDNIILNETAVKKLGYTPQSIINEKVVHYLGIKKVIGVVKNYHFMSLHSKIDPLILSNYSKDAYIYSILINQKYFKDISQQVTNKIESIDKNFKVEFGFLNEDLKHLYLHDENEITLFFIGTGICIVLSLVGFVALTSFTLLHRTKEVGLRKVLGASIFSILSMLYKDYMKMIIGVNLLMIPATLYFVNEWLNNYPYHIPIEMRYFLEGGLLIFSLMIVSVFYFVIKTAMQNPIDTFKYE